ncbi:hypothetical protein CMP1-16 [Clavibacter phage CMP1]|uniref:Uncharacterized protein n=1 Tax=Clavibacter phage CMP1 TaxID=686439 RepID=D0U200_9CAUD|nr:hypothetical protein CMP1-16 [Clavibacter phage CMP1]ACY35912.1 hypothetical protein CMP1-16 [Clavibacter phage CMP1]
MPTANLGAYPVDVKTPVGLVRLLIGDTDTAVIRTSPEGTQQGEFTWYSDEEIDALIGAHGGPKPTAVFILRLIAVNTAMLLKRFTSSDLASDGPAIADTLLKAADAIEKANNSAAAAEAASFFSITPTGHRPEPVIGYTNTDWAALGRNLDNAQRVI